MHREEDRLIIEPIRKPGLLATLAGLPTLEDEFPDVDQGLIPLDSLIYELTSLFTRYKHSL